VKLFRRRFLLLAATAAASLVASSIASAQTYPARPVRVIVPFAPGGPTDVFARLMAQKLSEHVGVQFYVENIVGAGGNIGAGRAAQAAPDGYTVLVNGANHVVNPALYQQVPYDPARDFDPVTLAVTSAVVLTVHPSVPAHTVRDIVELIKAQPGKYSYASPGAGTPPHLVGELFRLSLGLDLVHVPFNGGGPAIASAVAGHTPISFGTMAPAVPLVKDGKLRALAVSTKARSQALPDIPTMTEAGYRDIAGESWFVVAVPAGTPGEIIARLHRDIATVMTLPDMRERMATLGYEPVMSTPQQCAELLKTETARWTKVIRDAGIKAQ
jgi:tripartite-type tricarboxylate transporter receptor subunit TctC